jgi:hypothetical protein
VFPQCVAGDSGRHGPARSGPFSQQLPTQLPTHNHGLSRFLVLAAGLLKENSAPGGIFFRSGMVELFDLPPTFRAHGACSAAKVYHRVRQVDTARSLHAKEISNRLSFPPRFSG